ncbi:MAG: hypothetical protein HGB10_11835, partial [Coriobacteriia bacterium]|nr:hypothetical protein [Coriobacteriia bacterium]
ALSTYTFSNVTAPHTIAATFTPVTVAGSEMPVTYVNCDSCHIPGSALDEHEHPCANCHEVSWGHAGTPSEFHTAADVATCSPCHNASLTIEHNGRTTKAGAVIVCDTCHGSTATNVKAAIAAGNSACSACHASADHSLMHGSNVASMSVGSGSVVCGDCHAADVQVEHAMPSASSALLKCVTCHPTPRSSFATWGKGCVQGGCHPAGTPQEMHGGAGTAHAPAAANTECFASGCHRGADVSAIHASAETTVNGQARTSCMVCHANATLTKDCSTCHTAAGVDYHRNLATAHNPVAGQSCYAAGCHAATATDSLAQTHSSATTTVAGVTRTSCQVCHADGTPASGACDSCHADRVDGSHGYSLTTHTAANETCVGTCHSTVLSASHSGNTCASCHDSLVPAIGTWAKTCQTCHSNKLHTPTGDRHAGSDAGSGSPYLGYGCAGAEGMTCHDISDISVLHADSHNTAGGCVICHAPGKTPTATCVTCHSSAWGGDTSYMHHNNVKYLLNSADATPGAYYASEPANGWDEGLSNYDCQYCHSDFYGGASASPPAPISPYQGDKMWYSGLRSAAGSLNDTQLQIATMTVPAGGSLRFMTNYEIEVGKDYGYVEVQSDTTTWTPIAGTITSDANPFGLNLGNGIDGDSNGWVQAEFDLSEYAGQTVHIRFRFISNRYINLAGWAIDNVVITGSGGDAFSDDAETVNPSLESNGWLRVGAYPPAFTPDGPITRLATHDATVESTYVDGTKVACVECHRADLQAEHGKLTASTAEAGCAACHPTARGSLNPTWNGGCAQGSCHTVSSSAPLHAGFDTAHSNTDAYCSEPESGCHVLDMAATHSAASTTTVDGKVRTNCMVCHADGVPTIKTCSGCHAPTMDDVNALMDRHFAGTTHQSSPASQTITISGVSFGSKSCVGCHTAAVLAEHAKATSSGQTAGYGCTQCHPSPKNSLVPTWSKSCVQGGCHTPGSTAPMHASIDSVHEIPSARAACLDSGCHDAGGSKPFAGKSVAEIHSVATTTTDGVTRTGCEVCHASGVTPSADCLVCHPSRADSHGYDSVMHTSTETCYGVNSGCHANQLFDAQHVTTCTTCHASSDAGVQAAISSGSTACGSCHASSSSRYINAAGEAYVLAGAEHDVVNPQITQIALTHDAPANYAAPVVTWTTDRPATSEIEYVITSGLPSYPFEYPAQYPKTTVGSTSLTTTHSVSFPVTQLGRMYTYRIKTVDAQGKVSYSTDRDYYRWRASSDPQHNPSLPEPTLSGLSTDELNLSIIKADGSTVTTGAVAGWESQSAADVLPTPSNPGSPASATNVKWTDHTTYFDRSFGVCWKTNLATTEGSANWQLSKFRVDPSERGTLRDVDLSFLANGELADGHPVTLRLWDFQTQTWVKLTTRSKFEYYYNYAGQTRSFSYRAPTDPKQAYCIRCHQEVPPAGVDWVARTDMSKAWVTDAHGESDGTRNATTVIGYGGTIKAPYVRGDAALSCDVCHEHGSSNIYNLKTTVNGQAVQVVEDGVNIPDGDSLCSACHEGGPNVYHAKCITCHLDPSPGGVQSADQSMKPTDFNGSFCFDCHRHGVNNYVPMYTGSDALGCSRMADCHSSMKAF